MKFSYGKLLVISTLFAGLSLSCVHSHRGHTACGDCPKGCLNESKNHSCESCGHHHKSGHAHSAKKTNSCCAGHGKSQKQTVSPSVQNKQPSPARQNASSKNNSPPQTSSLNKVVADLSFTPLNGRPFRLSELSKDIKAVVIVMRERDCPISEKYAPRLSRLEKTYSEKGVKFIYNYVGQVKREDSARGDLKRHGFKGSYGIDTEMTVVDALSAKTTGDVFILTPDRRVVYRGPVDDQYHLLKSAIKPKNHYVANALQSLTSGKVVSPKELPAPGCLITRAL